MVTLRLPVRQGDGVMVSLYLPVQEIALGIAHLPEQPQILRRGLRHLLEILGYQQLEAHQVLDVLRRLPGEDFQEYHAPRLGVESEEGLVGDDPVGPGAHDARLFPVIRRSVAKPDARQELHLLGDRKSVV